MLLFVAACQPEPSISISPETYDATAAGGSFEFPVTANYEWTASSSSRWIRVSVDAENSKLKVHIEPNTDPDGREAVINLTCKELVKAFTIRQAQKNMVVVKDGTATVTWEQQSFEIPLQTNVDFTVSIEQDGNWLSYVSTKALVAKTLTLSVQENPQAVVREAHVILTGGGETLKNLTISQSGRPQVFTVVHNLNSFRVPVVFGFNMIATIFWGDGEKTHYNSTMTHTYARSGEHEVRIEASGAETASLSDLVGVLKVDVSEF